MEYHDLDVRIATGEGNVFPVLATSSVAGEFRGQLSLPFPASTIPQLRSELQGNVLAGRRRDIRRPVPAGVAGIRDVGNQLFQNLFSGDLATAYRLARQHATNADRGLRIRLRIEPAALVSLPWEFMYDDTERDYLCLSSQTPIVRYTELPKPPGVTNVEPPFRVLAMVSSPTDTEPLDVNKERQQVEAALAPLISQGLLELHWMNGATWQDLQWRINDREWHAFHFIGHGGLDPNVGEGILLLEGMDRRSFPLGASGIARILREAASMRLVVLNSCHGATEPGSDRFSGVAGALVRTGIPAVVAMQFAVSDAAAIEFAKEFYARVATGVGLDMALTKARIALSVELGSGEWGTPVLFMRSPDGMIFRGSVLEAGAAGVSVRPATVPPEGDDEAGVIDVFVSQPTWIDPAFEGGLQALRSELEARGHRLRTVGMGNDVTTGNGLEDVIRLLSACRGAIILGYPQVHVEKGRLKDGVVDDAFDLATEWNHIEAGLAYARGLPLLVVHHKSVVRGIFDPYSSPKPGFLYSSDLRREAWSTGPAFLNLFRGWDARVRQLMRGDGT